MIPDGLQYFLDDFWNLQKNHQIWTFTPLLYLEMLQTIQENMETFKTYFSYLIILEIQIFQGV